MRWRIYLLRKIRYGTDSKQGDDLYDFINTCEGRSDAHPWNWQALPSGGSVSVAKESPVSFHPTQTPQHHLNNLSLSHSSKCRVMIYSRRDTKKKNADPYLPFNLSKSINYGF